MKKLIIDKGVFYQRVAILNGDNLEFVDYNLEKGISIGDIYLAKIKSINNSNKSAFLELGDNLEAYLSENIDGIKQGELILVEVNKEAFGTKLPSVTRDISLAGENIVFLPRGNGLKYSRKLEGIENIKSLILKLENFIGKEGAVLRSGANLNSEEMILDELNSLKEEYKSYEDAARISNKPKLIKKAKESYEELISSKRENFEIIVNDKAIYKSLQKSKFITDKDELKLKETSLFSIYKITEENILGKTFDVDGAQVVIENTEAMTVIDVNSKGKELRLSREANILEVNLSICARLVQLIILKNISGIIIVDFINMKEKSNKEALVNRLKYEFRVDRNSVKVMEITSLGLVQIVRQRQGKSLLEKLTKRCSCCEGSGYEPNDMLKKIRLEEEIKMLGFEQATKKYDEFKEIFSSEEIQILEKSYKTLI